MLTMGLRGTATNKVQRTQNQGVLGGRRAAAVGRLSRAAREACEDVLREFRGFRLFVKLEHADSHKGVDQAQRE